MYFEATDGSRTHVFCLEGRCFAVKLQLHSSLWMRPINTHQGLFHDPPSILSVVISHLFKSDEIIENIKDFQLDEIIQNIKEIF
jgi:hypothetical protein